MNYSQDEDFDVEERRSLVVPASLALFVLLIIGYTLVRYTHHKEFAHGDIPSTVLYPIHSESHAAGQVGAGTQNDLYVLPIVELHNRISLPLFVEGISGDMTTADGTAFHCNGAQLTDFDAMYTAYPDLAHIVATTGDSPLARDTRVEPDTGSAHGLVMIHFPITEDTWQRRQSASVTISFYHQAPLVIPFPANQ